MWIFVHIFQIIKKYINVIFIPNKYRKSTEKWKKERKNTTLSSKSHKAETYWYSWVFGLKRTFILQKSDFITDFVINQERTYRLLILMMDIWSAFPLWIHSQRPLTENLKSFLNSLQCLAFSFHPPMLFKILT